MPTSAEKLLEKAKNTKSGWKRQELDRLYEGYGFIIRHGRSHDIVSHPDYPDLRATLSRSRTVKPAYISNAVRLITILQSRQETDAHE